MSTTASSWDAILSPKTSRSTRWSRFRTQPLTPTPFMINQVGEGSWSTARGDVVAVLTEADPANKAEIYTQRGLELTYQPGDHQAIAAAQPQAFMYERKCPRSGTGVRGPRSRGRCCPTPTTLISTQPSTRRTRSSRSGRNESREQLADRRRGTPLGGEHRMLRHYDSLGLVRPTGRTVGPGPRTRPPSIRRAPPWQETRPD